MRGTPQQIALTHTILCNKLYVTLIFTFTINTLCIEILLKVTILNIELLIIIRLA